MTSTDENDYEYQQDLVLSHSDKGDPEMNPIIQSIYYPMEIENNNKIIISYIDNTYDNFKEKLNNNFEIHKNIYFNGNFVEIVLIHKEYGVILIETEKNEITNNDIFKKLENIVHLLRDECINVHKTKNYKFIESKIKTAIFSQKNNKTTNYSNGNKNIIYDNFSKEEILNIFENIKDQYLLKDENVKGLTDSEYIEITKYCEEKPNIINFLISQDFKEINKLNECQKILKKYKTTNNNFKEFLKIKGVAGSGKTTFLVFSAIDALISGKKSVLILTKNKSLIPMIKNKLKNILQNFYSESLFYIDNYENFIKTQLNNNYKASLINKNLNDDLDFESTMKDLSLFSEIRTSKYEAVLIDEIQDFENEHLQNIRKHFVLNREKGGWLIMFGDEAQNLYGKEYFTNLKNIQDLRKDWVTLTGTYRFGEKITKIASLFQKEYYEEKNIQILKSNKNKTQGSVNFDYNKENIYYQYLDKTPKDLFDVINNSLKKISINIDDRSGKITILSDRNYFLQKIDKELSEKGINTMTTFCSQSEQSITYSSHKNRNNAMKKGLEKNKKINFFSLDNEVQISTIHSFKGNESNTIILIIRNFQFEKELIYTAITRAKKNLIIINIANSEYKDFFNSLISAGKYQKNKLISHYDIPFNQEIISDKKYLEIENEKQKIIIKESKKALKDLNSLEKNAEELEIRNNKLNYDLSEMKEARDVIFNQLKIDRVNTSFGDIQKNEILLLEKEITKLNKKISEIDFEKKEFRTSAIKKEEEIKELKKQNDEFIKEFDQSELSDENDKLKKDKFNLESKLLALSLATKESSTLSENSIIKYIDNLYNGKFKILTIGGIANKNIEEFSNEVKEFLEERFDIPPENIEIKSLFPNDDGVINFTSIKTNIRNKFYYISLGFIKGHNNKKESSGNTVSNIRNFSKKKKCFLGNTEVSKPLNISTLKNELEKYFNSIT